MLITEEYKKLNAELHSKEASYGASGHQSAGTVADIAHRLQTSDILDYGCGKGTLRAALGFPIHQYDPCIPEFSAPPEPADIVICGDVLEHIELNCLDAVLDDLQRVTKRAGVFVIANRPAKRTLSDGRNAHLIQQPLSWWQPKIEERFEIYRIKENKFGFVFFVGQKPIKKAVFKINGFVWPEYDKHCAQAAFKEVQDLHKYYEFCKKFDVAVQAGGNCGVWPKHMSRNFKLVYTFEPDPENFNCLTANVKDHNVIKMQAALGEKHGLIDVVTPHEDNCGSKFVTAGAMVPTIRIDDLNLPTLDFLMLDIEGAEVGAMVGGWDTIKKYKPLVVVENKKHTERFGYPMGTSIKMLEEIGYKVVLRAHADVVLCA